MRYIILTFLSCCYFTIFGQKQMLFNELFLSLNRTMLIEENVKNKFGFDIGITHVSNNTNNTKFYFGLGYSHTSQFHQIESKTTSSSKWKTNNNIKYKINSFSIPLGLRIYMNKNIHLNIGTFIDLVLNCKEVGNSYSSNYDSVNNRTMSIEITYKKNYYLPGIIYGTSLGIGSKVPVGNTSLNFILEYKYGLNPVEINNVFNRYANIKISLPIN